jgi:glycosyltransferase involved in cell wall biosynthesis
LEAAGIGRGRHAFEFTYLSPLSPDDLHVVRVFRESDGLDMPGSPVVIEPSRLFDDATRAFMSGILARDGPDEDLSRKIDWLFQELDLMLQQRADLDSKRGERARGRARAERWARRLVHGQGGPGDGASASAPGSDDPIFAQAMGGAVIEPRRILRALVIDDRTPKPDRDAGSVAILSHMRSLQRLGYEVAFIPAAAFADPEQDRTALEEIGASCYGAPYYATVEEVLLRQAGEFDVVYIHRVANAAKYLELARQHFPKARRIFSVADLHHLRLTRQAEAEDRPELLDRARRIRLAEFVAAAMADAVITHSAAEAKLLRTHVAGANIHTVLWSVPPRPTQTPFEKRRGIAFIGGYAHEPNRDAARWLIGEIMPLARRADPSIECQLVGSDLPDDLRRICGNGVIPVGHVPDLADVLGRVRLTVAPLAYGAGVNGKVVESFAAGIPCVYSPIAAEGLDLPPALAAFVAPDAQSFAAIILRLHRDEAVNAEASRAGLDFIAAAFSEGRLDAAMTEAIGTRTALR